MSTPTETDAPYSPVPDVTPSCMTFEEYVLHDFEDGLAEWAAGEVIRHAMPTHEHQRIVEFLDRLLGLFVQLLGLGLVRVAPFPMRIASGEKAREPDLLFLAAAHRNRLRSTYLDGPADLAIEVISTDSVARDRDVKFREYQAGGVAEYWIIDPRPGHERADFYVRDAHGQYQPIAIAQDGIYRSTVLRDFWLNLAWLWADEPNPLTALAEIVGVEQVIAALQKHGE